MKPIQLKKSQSIIKLLMIALVCSFSALPSFSQAPYWLHADREGASRPDGGRQILAVPTGETYIVGRFQNTISFPGVGTLNALAGNDSYLLKYDANNVLQWFIGLRGAALHEDVKGIEYDQSGNIILAGNFQDSVVIGSTKIHASGNLSNSAYLTKIDPNGNILFAKEIATATGGFNLAGMALDGGDEIFLAGDFGGDITIQGNNFAGIGGSDLFFANLDQNGTLEWFKVYGGIEFDQAMGMDVNIKGEMYVSAWISHTVSFGTIPAGRPSQTTMVMVHLDRNGQPLHVDNQVGTNSSENFDFVRATEAGEVFVGGDYSGNTKINHTNYMSNSRSRDIMLIQYDRVLNVNWVETAGGSSSEDLRGMDIDINGDVYLTGSFNGTATFGGTSITTPSFFGDGFLARYNHNASLEWVMPLGAGGFDLAAGFGVDVRDDGVGFATGEFTGNLTLSTHSLTAAGNVDLFWGIFCQNASVKIDAKIDGTHCKGSDLVVPFKPFGCFDNGNTFYLELSDASGAFTNPDTIGSVTGANAAGITNITGTIPSAAPSGTQYRIRIKGDLPAVVSDDNGFDLTIPNNPVPQLTALGNTTFCLGDSVQLTTSTLYTVYDWSNGASTASIFATESGSFSVTVTDANGCEGTDVITVTEAPVPNPSPSIFPSGTVALCNGNPISLDAGNGYASYAWSSGASAQNVNIAAPGTFTVTVTNGYGCEGVSAPVTVVASPAPVISQSNDTLYSTTAISYQWNLNGSPIAGANSQFYVPTSNGNYTVTITTSFGCIEESSPVNILLTGIQDLENGAGNMNVYPNPASDRVTITYQMEGSESIQIRLIDMAGRVWMEQAQSHHQATELDLNVDAFPAGIYLVQIQGETTRISQKLHIMK